MKSIKETVKKPQRPVKILQFGEGNFLRAFVDWIVDLRWSSPSRMAWAR